MSYSKTTWKTGDTITAQLLNHAEDGIAANDAAIAAIPEGLQLYGPYTAYHNTSENVESKNSKYIECENLEDVNGITVTYPDVTSACIILPVAVDASSLPIVEFSAPAIYANEGVNEWRDGTITVYNPDSETLRVASCSIVFYSTVEFPQES